MNDEERRIITGYVERVSGAAQPAPGPAAASPWGGSVPQTQAPARPPLPPVDADADRLIADLFARYPEARYRITQTAFVQEAALVEAQNRIRRLEWEVENAQREGQAAAAQPRGVFGGMFGGNRGPQPAPMPPPPQPQYPPGYNPQALQPAGRSGSGFLGTALMTAAGVAGGMVLGNALMGMFSGGAAHAAAGALGGAGTAAAGAFGQEAVPTSSPWTNPTGTQDDATPVADQNPGDQGGGSDQGVDSWGQQADAGADYSGSDDFGGGGSDDAAGFDEDV
ncbi:MAG TPA: DUF2076 domain-containing protein [Roseomonas sp.]|jgi:hypothetical protein